MRRIIDADQVRKDIHMAMAAFVRHLDRRFDEAGREYRRHGLQQIPNFTSRFEKLRYELKKKALEMEREQIRFLWKELYDQGPHDRATVRYIAQQIRRLNNELPAEYRNVDIEHMLDEEMDRHARAYAEMLLKRVRDNYVGSERKAWEAMVTSLRAALKTAGLNLEKIGSSNEEIARFRKLNREHNR